MKIKFKAGKLRYLTFIPTIVLSHNPYYKKWCDWALELHFLNLACGVNFYMINK